MQDKKVIKWTHDWPHYHAAAIEIAAALTKNGNANASTVAKQAFAVADALAREAQYRPPVNITASPLAWVRDQHEAAETTKQPLSSELSFLWRMASRGMQLAGTFWEMIQMIQKMPEAEVAALGNCSEPDDVERMRAAVILVLEVQSQQRG